MTMGIQSNTPRRWRGLMIGVALLTLTSTAMARVTPDQTRNGVAIAHAELNGGVLFGITGCSEQPCNTFVQMDPTTGVQTPVMVLDENPNYSINYGPDAYTFDATGDRLFMVIYHSPPTDPLTPLLKPTPAIHPLLTQAIPSDSSVSTPSDFTPYLMTINTATGIFTETGPITPLNVLGFNSVTNQLFGITGCVPEVCNTFVHVDQITGISTPIAELNTSGSVSYGIAQATDPNGQRFFMQRYANGEADPRLLTINTQTGAFTTTQPVSGLNHFGYDRATNSVVGIDSCPNNDPLCTAVLRIDTITGEQTIINQFNRDFHVAYSWEDAADVENHRLFLQRYEPGSPQPYLMTLDTTTGAITSTTQPISRSLNLLGYSPKPLPLTLRNVNNLWQRLYLPIVVR